MVNLYARAATIIATLCALWIASPTLAQSPEFYNNFGGTSSNSFPLNTTSSNKVQWVYAPGTLNSNGSTGSPAYSGLITTVYFRVNGANPSSVYSDFTISLGQNLGTTNTFSPTSGTFNFITGLTECFYAANYSLTGVTAGSWYGVELQTPFAFDPSLSLIFEMKVSGGTGNTVGQVTTSGLNQRIWGGFSSGTGSTGTGLVDFGIDLTYLPVPNNAGLTALPSISNGFCADTLPVTATIVNFGNNVIDSVFVDWTVNSVAQTGQWFTLNLDTFGSGNNDTTVTIGSYVFQTGNLYTVKAWTSMPNNENDTVNQNDTTEITVGPALAGTYTIGSSTTADFPDFATATAALNALGVCDHVIFNVESGSYNEQVTIGSILGSGPNRTVTFQSQSQDSSDVTLFFEGTSSNTSVITLNGASWVRIKHMTVNNTATVYDHAINIAGTSKQIQIERCMFNGTYNSTSSNAAVIVSTTSSNDSVLIKNNRFEGGGYAIYMYGSGTTALESGLVIEGNDIRNSYYHAVRLYYQNAPVVRNNFIQSNSSYTTGAGLYLVYCDNAVEVSSNHIITDPTAPNPWPYYGIYMSLSDGAGFTNTGRMFNNRVVIGSDTNTASSATFYALYMSSSNAQRIANNTFTVMKGGTSARAFYHTSSDLLFIRNNLFTVYSQGHAAYFNSGIAVDIDRNNYYAPAGTEIYYGGQNFNVNDFKLATGFDSNSLNVDPTWSDLYMAFPCNDMLDGLASSISYVQTDYSGYPRSMSQPDPGAVEFIGVNNFSLGGNLTVCGSEHVMEVSGATTGLVWQVNGNASNQNQVSISTTGSTPAQFNVNVSFTSATGCGNANDNVVITLVPNASLDSATHLCAGAVEVLNAGGGTQATYLWTPTGATTQTISISQPGIYSVTKEELGCTSQASSVVTQSIGVELLDAEVCADDMPYSVNATIPSGLNYVWDGGNSPNAALNVFENAGTYNVTATDVFGCASSASFNLAVIDVPTAIISESHYGNLYLFSSAFSQNAGSNATYLWSFGDGTTSSEANPQHLYTWSSVQTSFVVSLTIVNDCGTHTVSSTVYPDPLGIEVPSASAMTIFPNPASEMVQISFSEGAVSGTIEMLDVMGKVVFTEQVNGSSILDIDLSNIAKGAYILRLRSDARVSTEPLIIQ